jgi:hypothetical protein
LAKTRVITKERHKHQTEQKEPKENRKRLDNQKQALKTPITMYVDDP